MVSGNFQGAECLLARMFHQTGPETIVSGMNQGI